MDAKHVTGAAGLAGAIIVLINTFLKWKWGFIADPDTVAAETTVITSIIGGVWGFLQLRQKPAGGGQKGSA